MAERTPKRLGKYDIVREIGRGSMGAVYLGHDPFLGTDVAIKVAYPEAITDAESGHRYRKLFFNEAKAAGMLKHPNIVSVLDASEDGDLWYIVMEYVPDARSLHTHCRPESLLPTDTVVRLAFKCARALDFAHRKGVVHRDVKPRNILLTQDGEVKVSDFSIALITAHLDEAATQIHGYVGSPLYMSPEQVREDEVDCQTDVFSLGIVLYELLTGKHPFAAEKLPAVGYNIVHKRHPPLREVRADAPRVLEHIVDRALAKKPRARYRSCLDLAADLSLVFDNVDCAADVSGGEKFNLVKNLAFFAEFADPEIWEITHAAQWQQFAPGTEIITEGQVDDSFYVLVSGQVAVRKGSTELQTLAPGDCFGEMGLISHAQRSATIVAKDQVAVLKVRGSLIERVSPSCQLHFHKAFSRTMVARLSRANDRISALSA